MNILFDSPRAVFRSIGELVNIPEDQITLAGALVLSVPIGMLFMLIRGRLIRLILGALIGLYFQYLVYGDKVVWLILQTVFTYILVVTFKRRCGWPVFFANIFYLSAHHIHRQIYDYGSWKMDVTTILMMSVSQFTSFAWCIQDGCRYQELEKAKSQPQTDDKVKVRVPLTEDQEAHMLTVLPGFLEFASYIHFFNGAIMGPFVEFQDFSNFINFQAQYKHVPNPLFECLKLLLKFAVLVSITIFVFPLFPIDKLLTDEWANSNWFIKFFTYSVTITLFRLRYYTGWTLAQMSATGSGITYGGYDEQKQKHIWDHVLAALPELEFSHDIRWKIEQWNASIQVWLKRYIFFRVYTAEQIKQSATVAGRAQYATLFVSALWHGFYPGYYISFFLWSNMILLQKMIYKASQNRPELFNQLQATFGPLYYIVRWIVPNTFLNCFGMGFQYLSFERSLTFYQNINFDVHIFFFIVFGFFLATGFGQKPIKQTGDSAQSSDKDQKE